MVQNVIIIGRVRGEKCNNLVLGLFLYFTSGCHWCQFRVVNHPTALKQHLPWNEIIEEKSTATPLLKKTLPVNINPAQVYLQRLIAPTAASGVYFRQIAPIIIFPNVFLSSSSLSCWTYSGAGESVSPFPLTRRHNRSDFCRTTTWWWWWGGERWW